MNPSEMRVFSFLFLSLMVRDVFSVRGLYMAEVSILAEGQVPTDAEDEITCTMATIEPTDTDVKFVKYIASPEDIILKPGIWRNNNTARTFEECAGAAAASGSKMFLYDEGKCQISDSLYSQTDVCSKNHSQLVYVDVDADPDDTVKLSCNYDWTLTVKDGRPVNTFTENEETCDQEVSKLMIKEDSYHLIMLSKKRALSDQYTECSNVGALHCTPKDDSTMIQFINHLKEFVVFTNEDFTVGLNSSDDGASYMWASGVAMPNNHVGWSGGSPEEGYSCVFLDRDGLHPHACDENDHICCMVPYYAD